jgi:hypothetical protein
VLRNSVFINDLKAETSVITTEHSATAVVLRGTLLNELVSTIGGNPREEEDELNA